MREFQDDSMPKSGERAEQPGPDAEEAIRKKMSHEIELVGREAASEDSQQESEQGSSRPVNESPQMDRHR